VPRRYCGWQHRFDDPRREYRTLPCAEQAATCLREVLADLRPNARMRAEMAETVGPDRSVDSAAGLVSRELLAAHVLQPASIDAPAQPGFADLEDIPTREDLARRHARLLAAHSMDHLDLPEVRSHDRVVTQTIGRGLFEDGYVGVHFASHLDGRSCFALFEGRARLASRGAPQSLSIDLADLVLVCRQFGLTLADPLHGRLWLPLSKEHDDDGVVARVTDRTEVAADRLPQSRAAP